MLIVLFMVTATTLNFLINKVNFFKLNILEYFLLA